MSDSEWLQKQKTTHPSSITRLSTATSSTLPVKQTYGMWVFVALAVIVGLYFYFDTKHRQATKIATQQTATKTRPPPRTLTTAELQDIDARNRAYAKKLDDDYYHKEISTGILQLSNIAERFSDINQVAAGTPRIALAQVVQQMQSLRRDAAAITTHPCLKPGAASLTSAISEMVNGYLAFMQSRGNVADSLIKQHHDNAVAYVRQYVKQRDACVTW